MNSNLWPPVIGSRNRSRRCSSGSLAKYAATRTRPKFIRREASFRIHLEASNSVELLKIARDALLDLRHAPLHLGAREILVAVVRCLELAAVNRDAGLRQQPIARHSAIK